MICKQKPKEDETLTCKTCITPWHINCLSIRPETLVAAVQWECPDCSFVADPTPPAAGVVNLVAVGESEKSGDLIASIRAIESDQSLTDQEKAKKRQELLSGRTGSSNGDDANQKKQKSGGDIDVLGLLDASLNCSFCMQLPERPVTTPCGHNFCLKCFQKWVGQGKRTCVNCRTAIPAKMASQPRINSALVIAIRMAKMSKSNNVLGTPKVHHFIQNQNKPDKAYTTERAKKTGKANACSGKIFVTVASDHFGPIPAENDPERNQGVLVGESWEDRLECRQWGTHRTHVSGIAGQSAHGAQSVALSGGYQDDEDHGEWFLYTGSGGRDLSGNKRTNKAQSFDQTFIKMNQALRVSCQKGYPVRVVRSHKEKRSSYAPDTGVRYDGIYRIEKCWRKKGIQGFKVCRYLFVRCDNEPAPWTSDEHGDRPRPLPVIKELKEATDISERKGVPSWDFDEEKGCWLWKKPPPESKQQVECDEDGKKVRKVKRRGQNMSVREKLLKEFSCLICRKVMTLPLTTPCAHNFCKPCLEAAFAGKNFMRQRSSQGRSLRAQKNVMKCPSCTNDISDFLQDPQVNRELMGVIESLQRKTEEEDAEENADDEKLDDAIDEDMEDADEDLESLEDANADSETVDDDKDDNLKLSKETEVVEDVKEDNLKESQEKTKSHKTNKRKKASGGDCVPKPAGKRGRKAKTSV